MDILNTSDTKVTRPPCFAQVSRLLDTMYDVQVCADHVTVPHTMEEQVRERWLDGDVMLYKAFLNPKILMVTNRFTSETATFNPMRSMRLKRPDSSYREQILKIIEDSKVGCDFCVSNKTLEDSFGRISWKKSNIFTAKNAFRYFDYTSMIIPADIHSFLELDYVTFETMIAKVSVEWFEKTHKLHPDRTHPVIVWDFLAKAGASQVHPHINVLLGRGFYPGKWGHLDSVRMSYTADTNRDYLKDLITLHMSLGLGLKFKDAAVIVPIDPIRNREIWVIGSKNLDNWMWLLYVAYRTYIDELDVYCSSQSVALPTSVMTNTKVGKGGELMVGKLGARGDCMSCYSDVSSLELYSFNSISTDYYETMAAFRKTFLKLK